MQKLLDLDSFFFPFFPVLQRVMKDYASLATTASYSKNCHSGTIVLRLLTSKVVVSLWGEEILFERIESL